MTESLQDIERLVGRDANGRLVSTHSAIERFMQKVVRVPESGCWLWIGCVLKGSRFGGYGQFENPGGSNLAHRFAYEHFVGPVPAGLELDHLCRVRCCVNPKHLEPVTHRENTIRGPQPSKTHCRYGHPLSGSNLVTYHKQTLGWRQCRECKNACDRKRRLAQKIARAALSTAEG